MDEQQKNIDDIFRQSLGDYREVPPAAAWNRVAERLDHDERNHPAYFRRWPWIMLVLLLLVGGAWFVMSMYGRGGGGNSTKAVTMEHANTPTEVLETPLASASPYTTGGPIAGTSPLSANEENGAAPQNISEGPTNAPVSTAGASGIEAKTDGPTTAPSSKAGHPVDQQLSGTRSDPNDEAVANTPQATQKTTSAIAVTTPSPAVQTIRNKKKIAEQAPQTQNASAGKIAPDSQVMSKANPYADQPGNRKTASSAKKAAGKAEQSIDTGSNPPAHAKKPVVREKLATKARQTTNTPATQSHPSTQAIALNAASPKHSVAAKHKKAITQNNAPQTATPLLTVSTTAPSNKPAHAEHKAQPVDPLKNRKAHELEPALPLATAKPAKGNVSAQHIVKQTNAIPYAGVVAAASPSQNLTPILPVAAKQHTPTPKEPTAPIPATAPTKQQHQALATEDVTTAMPNAPLTGSFDTGSGTKAADSTLAPRKPRYPVSASFAILAGYEAGMQSPAPGRITGAVRFLLHVSPRASIGLQPAIRYGSVASQTLTVEKMYQRSSIDVESFTTLAASPSIRNAIDTLYNYVIRESFDSIVVGSSSIGGKSLEIELPVIFSYRLGKAWHVYGGPSLNFGGKLVTTTPSIQTYTTHRKDSLVQSVPIPSSEFVNYFGKSTLEPYSNYQPSAARVQDPASMRFGYLLGLGYDWKRIIFDASLHQQITGYKNVVQPLQQVYSSPYLRLSLGYILFPQKKPQKNDME